jgi:hypothetical protein
MPVLRHEVLYLYLNTGCLDCETRCTWCTRTDPRGGPVELAPEYRSRRSGHRSGWPTVNTSNCFILMSRSLTILAQGYRKKWLLYSTWGTRRHQEECCCTVRLVEANIPSVQSTCWYLYHYEARNVILKYLDKSKSWKVAAVMLIQE